MRTHVLLRNSYSYVYIVKLYCETKLTQPQNYQFPVLLINFSTRLKNHEVRMNLPTLSHPSYRFSKGILSGLVKLKLRIYQNKGSITL